MNNAINNTISFMKFVLRGCLCLGILFPLYAQGKELPNRLGLGIKNNSTFNIPSIAVTYFPHRDVALTGGVGIDTKKDYSKSIFDVGARRILFREDNMNFFFGGQLGIVNNEEASDRSSGFELMALFGGEFFFAGLDNLGFAFAGGVGVSNLKNTRFRTMADSPIQAGITFYF
ncbi:MAG: organic solvent tolerance protein [Pseudobdellovibrionaceae bacterium]